MLRWPMMLGALVGCVGCWIGCVQPAATTTPCPNAPDPPTLVRVPTKQMTYVFRSSRTANLAYEIDCLAGLLACSRSAYEKRWGAFSNDDNAMFDRWRKLRSKYSGRVELEDATSVGLPFPGPSIVLEKRLGIAGRDATSIDELGRSFRVIASTNDSDAAIGVLRHFEPRFAPEWARAKPGLDAAARGFGSLLERADIVALVDRVAEFYGPDFGPGASHVFDLFARPNDDSPDHGDIFDDHSGIEFADGQTPADRLGVVIHEVFHRFFAARPLAERSQLAASFADGSTPVSHYTYALLDEVLAVTFAQGMLDRIAVPDEWARRSKKAKGFYADEDIDAVAKAFLPRAERMLAGNASLHDDACVTEMIIAGQSTFPDGISIGKLLRMSFVLRDTALPVLHQTYGAVVHTTWAAESDFDDDGLRNQVEKKWAKLPTVWVARKVDAVRRFEDLLGKAVLASPRAKNPKSFAFATHRPNGALAYVVQLERDEDWKPLLEKLVVLPATTADGVIVDLAK